MKMLTKMLVVTTMIFGLCSCASNRQMQQQPIQMANTEVAPKPPANYAERLPSQMNTNGKKMVLIDPNVHAWGAYNSEGNLVKAGLATAGSSWCPDIKRACKTKAGSFRVQSLGAASCKSSIYPLPRGGAPMPYCMAFNGNQMMHGSAPGNVIEGNASHGCVRMHVSDAEWLRNDFVNIGTKVMVRPY